MPETISGVGINQIHIACATVLRAAPLYQGRLIVGILADRTDALYADWAARLRLLRTARCEKGDMSAT